MYFLFVFHKKGCAQVGNALSVPATSVLSGLMILMSYFVSHGVVNPIRTDWFEPVLVWVVIVMPTGAGKSTLFKFLKGILDTVKRSFLQFKREKSTRLECRRGNDGKDGSDDV